LKSNIKNNVCPSDRHHPYPRPGHGKDKNNYFKKVKNENNLFFQSNTHVKCPNDIECVIWFTPNMEGQKCKQYVCTNEGDFPCNLKDCQASFTLFNSNLPFNLITFQLKWVDGLDECRHVTCDGKKEKGSLQWLEITVFLALIIAAWFRHKIASGLQWCFDKVKARLSRPAQAFVQEPPDEEEDQEEDQAVERSPLMQRFRRNSLHAVDNYFSM
jgi:hypothetical protein